MRVFERLRERIRGAFAEPELHETVISDVAETERAERGTRVAAPVVRPRRIRRPEDPLQTGVAAALPSRAWANPPSLAAHASDRSQARRAIAFAAKPCSASTRT
jgi:hypothetical protein